MVVGASRPWHPSESSCLLVVCLKGVVLDYPKGGTQTLVDALVRGVEKKGGKIMLSAHVDEVLVENNKACGVRLRGGGTVRASRWAQRENSVSVEFGVCSRLNRERGVCVAPAMRKAPCDSGGHSGTGRSVAAHFEESKFARIRYMWSSDWSMALATVPLVSSLCWPEMDALHARAMKRAFSGRHNARV